MHGSLNMNCDESLFRTRTVTGECNYLRHSVRPNCCDVSHIIAVKLRRWITGDAVKHRGVHSSSCTADAAVTLLLHGQHKGVRWYEEGQSGAFATCDGGWSAGFEWIQVGAQGMARHTGYCFQRKYPFGGDTFAPPLVDSLRGNPQSLSQGTKPTSQTDNSIQWFFRHAHKSTTG